MNEGIKTVIYPVSDLAKAKTLYAALLGSEPAADYPNYVGFTVDGQHIGLDPNGHKSGMTGPVPFCHVDDIRVTISALLDAGAQSQQEVRDVGGGRLIATLKDADGNPIGLIQSPW